ncbi:MAG: NADH-quinone oxidoreductase subunit L [Bryobacteraceae bacterium]|nr:NADH-quinone oxidoreductase subunit L [Bryobacteraceae bacterium]
MVALAILLSPLLGAAAMLGVGRRLPRAAVSALCCATIALSFALSWIVDPGRYFIGSWLPLLGADWAFLLDELSLKMIRLVTGIGLLIHVYSTGYMAHEDGYSRYFGYLNLFVFFMLLLVMADNYALAFAGWEGVGLASYLLIGFFYDRKPTGDAANKAFLTNRVGDLGYLQFMFAMLAGVGSLNYGDTAEYRGPAAFLLLLAATGKSAQLPLYTWLPDAMEGPTPVSALIHAATMVTAGVYIVIRSQAMFVGLEILAWVGLATALLAALIATVQNDIKRVLAFSTVSQLGLMFLALGVGAYDAALLHLLTHAFFKALLFLGAGSVIHGLGGEQDLRRMGGLKRSMPLTFWTMLTGVLAIAGVPGLSGFFSKDEILAAVSHRSQWLAAGGLVVSLLTAFYTWRMFRMTFLGTARSEVRAHESPYAMLIPMLALAVGSVVAGWGAHIELPIAAASVVALLIGFALAHRGFEFPAAFAKLHALDGFYHTFFVKGLAQGGGRALALFDRGAIDGAVDGTGFFARVLSRISILWDTWVVDGIVRLTGHGVRLASYPTRLLHSGALQSYGAMVLLGVIAFLGWAATR